MLHLRYCTCIKFAGLDSLQSWTEYIRIYYTITRNLFGIIMVGLLMLICFTHCRTLGPDIWTKVSEQATPRAARLRIIHFLTCQRLSTTIWFQNFKLSHMSCQARTNTAWLRGSLILLFWSLAEGFWYPQATYRSTSTAHMAWNSEVIGKQSANETANQQVRATKSACRPVISLSNADLSCFIQQNSRSTAIHQWYHTSNRKTYNECLNRQKLLDNFWMLQYWLVDCNVPEHRISVILEIQQDIS